MKYVFPEIDQVFDTECGFVNTLVIEHPPLMYRLLCDLTSQLEGCEGKSVLSADGKILPIQKHLELLDRFVPFDLNKKSLVTKACALLEQEAMCGERYAQTVEMLGSLRRYLYNLSFDLPGSVDFMKLDIGTLIRSVVLEFQTEKHRLCEQILDYFELVYALDKKKLFITINLRCYISDAECASFIDTVLLHGYNLIMIENTERPRLKQEHRCIVDRDLCEISY